MYPTYTLAFAQKIGPERAPSRPESTLHFPTSRFRISQPEVDHERASGGQRSNTDFRARSGRPRAAERTQDDSPTLPFAVPKPSSPTSLASAPLPHHTCPHIRNFEFGPLVLILEALVSGISLYSSKNNQLITNFTEFILTLLPTTTNSPSPAFDNDDALTLALHAPVRPGVRRGLPTTT